MIPDELILNSICFTVSAVLLWFIIYMYRCYQPKHYGKLFWAFFIMLCAAFTYYLYDGLADTLKPIIFSNAKDVVASTALITNINILKFIVPGVMASVAANLITEFINSKGNR